VGEIVGYLRKRYEKMKAQSQKGSVKVDKKTGELTELSHAQRSFASGYRARVQDEAKAFRKRQKARLSKQDFDKLPF
jgi:hypothetical protein